MTNKRWQDEAIGLLVLGMHRSGTSAVTGVLEELGIPVPGELLGPQSDNEKGFFENRSVYLFHDQLLAHLGSAWDDPMPVSNHFVDTLAGERFVAGLADIIERELLSDAPIFAVKDPRMCRFVPFWLKALARIDASPRAIIPLRHPLAVAGSLHKRNGFPRAKSLLLWLDHTLAAEFQTRTIPRSFLSYDRLLADWRGAADKLSGDLDLDWPKERGRVEAEIDGFLSESLRHHRADGDIDGSTRLEALVAESWNALQALVASPDDESIRERIDQVRAELAAATAVVTPYVAWEFKEFNKVRQEADRLGAVEEALRQERADFETAIRAELHAAHVTFQAEQDQALVAHQQAIDDLNETHVWTIDDLNKAHKWAIDNLREEHGKTASALAVETRSMNEAQNRANAFEQHVNHLNGVIADLQSAYDSEHQQLLAMRASAAWRATGPVRRVLGRLPTSFRRTIRRTAKAAWWTLTPWRMPARMAFLRQRDHPVLATPVDAAAEDAPTPTEASRGEPALPEVADVSSQEAPNAGENALVSRPPLRGASIQPPLRVFNVSDGPARLSMVTDSINAGSLFGGVATALIFSALLARKTGRRLRIVSRTQAAATENVATVFRAHGIDWTDNIEFVLADVNDDSSQIDLLPDEIFVTTSWWTTKATRQTISDDKILYILQEDERMFYPFGDDYLNCSEILKDPAVRKVINSGLLHRHLSEDGVIDEKVPFFEPSFPNRIYFPEPVEGGQKRNFFFYARPNNSRNLYDRGLRVIETAIERRILDPNEWNIHFVGKDLKPMRIAGGVEPIILQNMAWEDYAAYVRSVDLALTLMYTPHPSYPPLDVAACGGVVVTNRFGVKTDLTCYSRSIVCVDSEVDDLVGGLERGVKKSIDMQARRQDHADSGILRDWNTSFVPVFEHLGEFGRVR